MFPEGREIEDLPTIKQLVYAQAAFDCGSFSDAALLHDVKAQAVSRAVDQLELTLGEGVRLFHRTKGSALVPTELGNDLRLQMDRVVNAMGELVELARTSKSAKALRPVTVGCYPVHLARYAALFTTEGSGPGLAFEQTAREAIDGFHQGVRLLRLGSVDLAIATQTALPTDQKWLQFERLYRWTCVAYGPRLADVVSEPHISARALAEYPLLVTPGHHSSRKELNKIMGRERRRMKVVVESSDVLSLIRLAEEGVGVAVIPSDSAEAAGIADDQFVPVRQTGGANYVAWNSELERLDPARFTLVQSVRDQFLRMETK